MLPKKINSSTTAYLPLSSGEITYFDREKFEDTAMFKWSLTTNGSKKYAMRKDHNGKTVYLHNFLYAHLKSNDKEVIDHIDGDGLNNRSNNIRIISKRGNSLNSKCKGFYLDKVRNRYRTRLQCKGIKVVNRSFESEAEASNYSKKLREKLIEIIGYRSVR